MTNIYTMRGDGLGTRLLSAVYAKILAKAIDAKLYVGWPPLGGADIYSTYRTLHPSLILEIFKNNSLFIEEDRNLRGEIVSHDYVSDKDLISMIGHNSEIKHLSAADIVKFADSKDGLLYDYPGSLVDFITNSTNLKQSTIAAWKSINWSDEIIQSINLLNLKYNLNNCIAAHVRRGDLVDIIKRGDMEFLLNGGIEMVFQRFMATDAFFAEIDRSSSPDPIILCTEDTHVLGEFREKYGSDRIITTKDLSLTENQQAATDLILLSMAKKIICPPISFFSTCAAVVGNAEVSRGAWRLEQNIETLLSFVDYKDFDRKNKVYAMLCVVAAHIAHEADQSKFGYFRAEAIRTDKKVAERLKF